MKSWCKTKYKRGSKFYEQECREDKGLKRALILEAILATLLFGCIPSIVVEGLIAEGGLAALVILTFLGVLKFINSRIKKGIKDQYLRL